MIKVYEYKACSTCKKGLKFLKDNGIEFEAIPIVDKPPSKAELKKMLGYLSGETKKLFNTSGQVYRELGLKDKIAEMSDEEALSLLAKNGKLTKRPFLLGDSFGTVGFKEDTWSSLVL